MSYSVLLIGATGALGSRTAATLSNYRDQFKRVAFVTRTADAGPEKEAKYKTIPLPRLVGSFEDPATYNGFDIVVSSINDEGAQINYIDAAFAGGVKHFYPSEYGLDLSRPEVQGESFFVHKLNVRKHLEDIANRDSSKGFTYIMAGMWSNWLLEHNVLGLSDDKKSANFLGSHDTMLTTTHVDDVAALVALSLLPSHFKSLSDHRRIRIAGSTSTVSQYFSVLSQGLEHGIDVHYVSKDASEAQAEEFKAQGNYLMYVLTPLRRAFGFGGAVLDDVDNGSYPEIRAKTWEDVVKATFA